MIIETGSSNRSTPERRGFDARAVNLWKKLHHEFNALMEEEHRIVEQQIDGDNLYAYFTYRQAGELAGFWLEGVASESFAARFELLATEGGVALGAPKGTSPLSYWFDRFLLDLCANKSNHLRMCSGVAGFVERLLEASGLYCARLARRSLEGTADPAATPESPVAGDSVEERSERRGALMMPMLRTKGWTRSRWAAQAGVSKNSVYGYLRGERNLSVENRQALAEELGLKPEGVPD